MSIRLPRLLDAYQQERTRLHPLKLGFSLRLRPLSTAEMLLGDDAPTVAVRDLMELYDENGSAGIFRVSAIDWEPGLRRRITLEHGLVTLSDGVVPSMSITGTPREVLDRLLGYQPHIHWMLGDIDLPEDTTLLFTCGYTNLLSALLSAVELLPDGYMLDYDQSGSVWVLHIRALSDTDACEGRLKRNLSSLSISTDGSDLCTRVYPFGAGQGTDRIRLTPLTGTDYLDSDAVDKWGLICASFTAGSIYDVPTLKAVAERYLARHAEPTVSITAEAVDLSASTGEPADSFLLGRLCRLALPQEQLVLHERIVAIDKEDVFGQSGMVVITLRNRLNSTSDEIADMLREVTASKVLGGRVTDVTTTSRANGTAASAIEHYFRVENVAAVLACRITFDPDDGVRVVDMTVDGSSVPENVYASGAFDALAYLKRDEMGVVTTGRHTLAIYPDSGAVNSTVTLTVIQNI